MNRHVYADPAGNAVPHTRSESYSSQGSYTYSESEEFNSKQHNNKNKVSSVPIPAPQTIINQKAATKQTAAPVLNQQSQLTKTHKYNDPNFKINITNNSNGKKQLQQQKQSFQLQQAQQRAFQTKGVVQMFSTNNERENGKRNLPTRHDVAVRQLMQQHKHHNVRVQRQYQQQQQLSRQQQRGQSRQKKRVNAKTQSTSRSFLPSMANISNKLKGIRTPFVERICLYTLTILSFIELIFYILASTLSQLDQINNACYTYWGFKNECGTVSYTIRTALMYQCPSLRANFQAGAAFSILTIVASTFTFTIILLMCCMLPKQPHTVFHKIRQLNVDGLVQRHQQQQRQNAQGRSDVLDSAADQAQTRMQAKRIRRMKIIALITMTLTLIFELISWAVIVDIYQRRICEIANQPRQRTYGAGFGIGLTAWLIELLSLGVFVLLM